MFETGKKLLYITNPKAGMQGATRGLYTAVNAFCADGFDVSVRVTQSAGDATETVKNIGSQYDYIVANGGDGTLNEVIKGILTLRTRPKIGYIPSGSTNDFGTNMGLKKNDFKGGAKRIINGTPFDMDVGVIEDVPFSYVASFGAFTAVCYETPQSAKNVWGRLAYFLVAAKDLASIKPIRVKVTTKEGETVEDEYLFGCVSNTFSMAGLVNFENLKVKLDDGMFECMLIKVPDGAIALNKIITSLVSQDFLNCPYIDILRSSEFNFEFEERQDWTIDGEYGPFGEKVNIYAAPKAITLMI